jgi:hypothetical protein
MLTRNVNPVTTMTTFHSDRDRSLSRQTNLANELVGRLSFPDKVVSISGTK